MYYLNKSTEVIHRGVKTINAKGSDIIISVHIYDGSSSSIQKDLKSQIRTWKSVKYDTQVLVVPYNMWYRWQLTKKQQQKQQNSAAAQI